jgi:signal transduction histidine kinase
MQEMINLEKEGEIDSAILTKFMKVFNKYQYSNLEKAEKTGQYVITTLEKLEKYDLLDEWYGAMGHFYEYYKFYSFALEMYTKGLENSKYLGNENPWWLIDIGNIYSVTGKFDKSLEYYNKAIKEFTKLIKKRNVTANQGIAVAYSNIGLLYFDKKNYDSSLMMMHYSMKYRKLINDYNSLTYICVSIADVFIGAGNSDSTLYYLKLADDFNSRIDDMSAKYTPIIYKEKSKLAIMQKDYVKALAMSDSAVRFSGLQNNDLNKLLAYKSLLYIYEKIDSIPLAIEYGKKLLETTNKLNDTKEHIKVLSKLSELYFKRGNYKNSYNYQSKYIKEYMETEKSNLDLLLYKFEAKQKEQKLKKELVLAERNKSLYLYLTIATVIGLVMLIVLIFNVFRNSKILRKKNKLIDTQNKDITNSNKLLKEKNKLLSKTLKELKETQLQLVQSEKMASLGILTAGIAHEINNPINFVFAGIHSLMLDFKDIDPVLKEIGNLSSDSNGLQEKVAKIEKLKKEHYFDESYKAIPEILQDIKVGAERATEIVKGLRAFSSIDQGEMKKADIHESIENSLLLLKHKATENITIIKNYDKSLPKILCYPGKLNQAFLNIISNAFDSIHKKGKITLTTWSENKELFISIKDTGTGMSKETEKKLFDPFYTTKEIGKGTGLGLSITYGIIKDHNGEIKVFSEPDKGSEFIIILPIKL